MDNFTPIASTLGGVLIGLSAAGMMLVHGRICGISGIFGEVVTSPRSAGGWRIAFVVGLIAGGGLVLGFDPALMHNSVQLSMPLTALAGALVGVGTGLGSGCTSGHGVCGLSRLSPRSLAATATFMGLGGVAAYLVQHVLGGGA